MRFARRPRYVREGIGDAGPAEADMRDVTATQVVLERAAAAKSDVMIATVAVGGALALAAYLMVRRK